MHNKPKGQLAALLSAGITFVANITAVVGLLLNHVDVIVVTAATLAVLGGLYLLLRCWGKPFGWYAMMMVCMVVIGSVALALSLRSYYDNNHFAAMRPLDNFRNDSTR